MNHASVSLTFDSAPVARFRPRWSMRGSLIAMERYIGMPLFEGEACRQLIDAGGIVLAMDKEGRIIHPKIKLHIVAGLARGKMGVVHGIVVHQTGGATAAAAVVGYKVRPYGTLSECVASLLHSSHREAKSSLPCRT